MKKRILLLIVVTLFTILNVTYASNDAAKVEGILNAVRITSNGNDITSQVRSVLIDGSTYLAVRDMANLFNKDLAWDGLSSTVILNDKADSSLAALNQQMQQKNNELTQLNEKINQMQAELDRLRGGSSYIGGSSTYPGSSSYYSPSGVYSEYNYYTQGGYIDPRVLQNELSRLYGRYNNIVFDFSLTGSVANLYLDVEVNLNSYGSKWSSMTRTSKEDFIQRLFDEIYRVYPYSTKITGDILDSSRSSYSSSKLGTFSSGTNGAVRLTLSTSSSSSSSSYDFEILADDLLYEYENHFDRYGIYIDYITITGTQSSPVFNVYIDYANYSREWNDIGDSIVRNFMRSVYNRVDEELYPNKVTGYIYREGTTTRMAYYTKSTSSTSETFTRY